MDKTHISLSQQYQFMFIDICNHQKTIPIWRCCVKPTYDYLNSAVFMSPCSSLILGLWMKLSLVSEDQLPQLPVRGLTHGFCLHAHLVLVWRELVRAPLLVPQVEEAAGRRADHHQLTVEVLPVQMHVLQPPAFDGSVETTWGKQKNTKVAWHTKLEKVKQITHIVSLFVLSGNANDAFSSATYVDEIRSVLTCHSKSKISPESRFLPYYLEISRNTSRKHHDDICIYPFR